MRDAAKDAGPTHGDARIDYVWTNRAEVFGAKVVDTNLSDHRPVVVAMRVE